MDKKFAIYDIEDMLKQLGFVWSVNLVYHPKSDSYKSATIKDFKDQANLLVIRSGTSNASHVKATINDEQFIIQFGAKIWDKSEQWQERLSNMQEL